MPSELSPAYVAAMANLAGYHQQYPGAAASLPQGGGMAGQSGGGGSGYVNAHYPQYGATMAAGSYWPPISAGQQPPSMAPLQQQGAKGAALSGPDSGPGKGNGGGASAPSAAGADRPIAMHQKGDHHHHHHPKEDAPRKAAAQPGAFVPGSTRTAASDHVSHTGASTKSQRS